jgi:hypothetical protein
VIGLFNYSQRGKNLDKINRERIWRLIQSTGDELLGKLPEHLNHPKGRNPYAHVALKVKDRFGFSYKDIADEKYQEVVEFLYLMQTEEG